MLLAQAAGAAGAQSRKTPDIHFTPTRHEVADTMLRLAGTTDADVVYDLGAGDGRIVIIAAQRYGARGVGIEIDAALVARARENAREAGVADRVTFIEGDLFAADLAPATVVTLYLSASINRRLEPKLRRELRPGARVSCHTSSESEIGRPTSTSEPSLRTCTCGEWGRERAGSRVRGFSGSRFSGSTAHPAPRHPAPGTRHPGTRHPAPGTRHPG